MNVMLTTIDNPFNPFDDYVKWNQFDLDHLYNSSERLMSIAKVSNALTDEENDREVENAIDTFIKLDFMNIYMKIKPGQKPPAAPD